MKKITAGLFFICAFAGSGLYAQPENVKRDYLPGVKRSVTSKVNLVSVVKTDTDPLKIRCTSVNTILEEGPTPKKDVWIQSVNETGNILTSTRYGKPATTEEASSLIRCPNGDIIVVAMSFVAPTAAYNGITSCWIFRKGIINWSYRYYWPTDAMVTGASGDTTYFRPYCIQKTNEVAENYIVAAGIDYVTTNYTPGTASPFATPVLFKLSANGDVLWCKRYTELPGGGILLASVFHPKSMLINNDTIVLAGNYFFSPNNVTGNTEIFVIAVNQTNGDIIRTKSSLAVTGGKATNPFINMGYGNEYILTFQTTSAVDGVTMPRATFARLDYNLNLIGDPLLYWDNSAVSTFGHSIYKKRTAVEGYIIGGGVTYNTSGSLSSSPLIINLSKTGVPDISQCQRFWPSVNYNSTFMMEDALITNSTFRHVFHSYKNISPNLSMSLIRAVTKPVTNVCNTVVNIAYRPVTAAFIGRGYMSYAITRNDMLRESYTYNSTIVLPTLANCE